MLYILKNHFLYVIGSVAYFILGGLLLGGTAQSFIVAFIFYALSVIISLSPTAEKLLRFINGIRPIETNEEREYLLPIYKEVLQKMTQRRAGNILYISKIELCIIDKMEVNACAVGRGTVAITKGAIKAFDEEQLKGIIAHEIAHIKNRDTITNMFILVGSGYFYLAVMLLKSILLFLDKFSQNTSSENNKSSYSALQGFIKILIFIFTIIMQIVLSIESRKREYKADKTAFNYGYGEGLISALYLLEKISLGEYGSLRQRLSASHPRITARIGKLEG